jgi:hypothetical protein
VRRTRIEQTSREIRNSTAAPVAFFASKRAIDADKMRISGGFGQTLQWHVDCIDFGGQ